MCVLIKGIGRRLPLELQCSLYQGQQGDVNQSVRGIAYICQPVTAADDDDDDDDVGDDDCMRACVLTMGVPATVPGHCGRPVACTE